MLGLSFRNLALEDHAFEGVDASDGDPMTLNGVLAKTLGLLLIFVAGIAFSWGLAGSRGPAGGSSGFDTLTALFLLGAFALGLLIWAFRACALFLSPVFVAFSGLFFGSVTFGAAVFSLVVVSQIAVLLAAVVALRFGLAEPSGKFGTWLVATAGGCVLAFLAQAAFVPPGMKGVLLAEAGLGGAMIGLLVSAAFAWLLAYDFEQIGRGVDGGVSRHLEWYCAFGLIAAIAWLYLSVLSMGRIFFRAFS